MTLSPSDVEQKTFSTALRGYDLDEVDDFLDEVVATIRDLNEQITSGEPAEPSAGVRDSTQEARADESAVGRALVAAQQTADRIVAEAEEEAERILTAAREEADTLAGERERRKAEAEAEMRELAEHVASVRSQLAVLATAVADRLDEMDDALKSQPGPSEVGDAAVEPDADGSDSDDQDGDDDEIEEFTLEEVREDHEPAGTEEEESSDDEDDVETA